MAEGVKRRSVHVAIDFACECALEAFGDRGFVRTTRSLRKLGCKPGHDDIDGSGSGAAAVARDEDADRAEWPRDPTIDRIKPGERTRSECPLG
jgi:hypothetical protein